MSQLNKIIFFALLLGLSVVAQGQSQIVDGAISPRRGQNENTDQIEVTEIQSNSRASWVGVNRVDDTVSAADSSTQSSKKAAARPAQIPSLQLFEFPPTARSAAELVAPQADFSPRRFERFGNDAPFEYKSNASGFFDFADCNGNNIADHLDISSGTSLDANLDGVPDECQDCEDGDRNGMADSDEALFATGLIAQYFDDEVSQAGDFRRRVLVRIDPTISFDWAGGSPDPLVPQNEFSVRWMGTLTAPTSGVYTFFSRSDDGFRLWINGLPVIDAWVPQSALEWIAGTVTLVAGQRYAFRVDYYEGGGDARVFLEWQPSGQARSPVPTSAFQPMTDVDANGIPDLTRDCNANGIADSTEIATGAAIDCNHNCIIDSCEPTAADVSGYWRFEQSSQQVVDSGPFGLTGNGVGLLPSTSRPNQFVPATSQENESATGLAPSSNNTGHFVVNDPQGECASNGNSFTVEAWVKIDTLATGSTSEGRQTLVQRKRLTDGDKFLDWMFLVQAADYPNVGIRNFGSQWNEKSIALVFGNGGTANSSFWTVSSRLSISDNQWHYVAAIFDAGRSEVTFVLDQQMDKVMFLSQGRVLTNAPLVIGAHTSTTGQFNQRVKGSVDELRISGRALEPALLLARPGTADCNANSVPDGCDLDSGFGDCNANGVLDVCEPDCNNNGIADACEITGGAPDCNQDGVLDSCQLTNNDCDQNGVPDDCQLAVGDCNSNGIVDSCDIAADPSLDCDLNSALDICQILTPQLYRLSDTGPEFGVRSIGTDMAWLTQFRVADNANLITAIECMFVMMPDNHPVTVYLWSDPNNDGIPDDAQVLASVATTAAPLSQMRRFDIADIDVGPNGTSFFVGAITNTNAVTSLFPAAVDTSGAAIFNRSWIIGKNSTINPNALADGAEEFSRLEDSLPFPGKWILGGVSLRRQNDCNINNQLDVCDIANGISADVNSSGTPDECEDCNENGVLDNVDIANGTSPDCQLDGIPDECQTSLFSQDCNDDNIPDLCQLANQDCNENGILDSCDLASGESQDSNGSGIPDECEDCNQNGLIDSTDIATGFSLDCQSDGIPDECQLGDPPTESVYLLDDGTREGNYGVTGAADLVWLNQFNTVAGSEWIGGISVVIGNGISLHPYEVILWSDPNGDGIPNDAQVIAQASTTVRDPNTSIFHTTFITPTEVGPAGTSFFVGVYFQDPYGNQSVTSADLSGPLFRSWISFGSIGTVNINNLSASAIYGYLTQANVLVRAEGFDGILPNDCNSNGVPDECDTVLSCGCDADLNGDGIVGGLDLAVVLSSWATSGKAAAGDINNDGVVDGLDLATLLSAWGLCN